jgi:hypothetical protein
MAPMWHQNGGNWIPSHFLIDIFLGFLVGCMRGYNLTFWRPQAPPNYAILGDCVTSRFVDLLLRFCDPFVFYCCSGISIKSLCFVYTS